LEESVVICSFLLLNWEDQRALNQLLASRHLTIQTGGFLELESMIPIAIMQMLMQQSMS